MKKYAILYMSEEIFPSDGNSEESSSNFQFTRHGPFRILGVAYTIWREHCRGAEGHAGGWMWFRGSWEGKRGHPSIALVVALCVPLDRRKVLQTINFAEVRFWISKGVSER